MSRIKKRLREVILSREVRMRLSGEEICQALAEHSLKKGISTFRSEAGQEILIVTEDAMTRVMFQSQP